MQAVGTIANGAVSPLYHRTNRAKHPKGDRKKEKSCGTFGCRNAFLNNAFTPIYTQSLKREYYDENINFISRESYEHLRDSYFRYARLMDKVPHHKPGKSYGEGIYNLYQEMNELIGEGINLNLEIGQDKLDFTLWKHHQWGDLTLYWFPVKFVESLCTSLRRITITFLHCLMQSNRFDTMCGDQDFEFIVEILDNDLSEIEDKKERKQAISTIHSYADGKAFKLLRRVKKRSYHKNLKTALENYSPNNDFERKLIALMQEGLLFIGKDKPALLNYECDPYYDDLHDFPPMELGQQVRIIYDLDDVVTEYMTENFNACCRESYAIVPTTTLSLSPQTDSLFAMDDYPERFFGWADRFINHIA